MERHVCSEFCFSCRDSEKERSSLDYVGSFIDDLVNSDGSVNWFEAHSGSYR
jgi:hypothetical protein